MTQHAFNPATNCDEASYMSSTMFSARSALFDDDKSDVSSIQQFFMAEERREKVAEVTKQSNVRAMKQKFEQASKSKCESPRHKLACGSLAERKRQLQQVLPLTEEEVSESSQLSVNILDYGQDQKKTFKSSGAKLLNSGRRNKYISRVADRKKMFEKTSLSTDIRSRGEGIHVEKTSQESTLLTVTQSESEFSALDYDGSLFSDDTQAGRDEVEATRRLQAPEKRETMEIRSEVHPEPVYITAMPLNDSFDEVMAESEGQADPTGESPDDIFRDVVEDTAQQGLAYTTSLSPNNSFQEALHEIVQSFQDDSSPQQVPLGHTSHEAVKDNDELGDATRHSTVYVMESGRADDPSPVSMLTSVASSNSKGSVASGDIMVMNAQGQVDMTAVEKAGAGSSLSEELPNSSVFSTVLQEEERERANEQATTSYGPYDELNPERTERMAKEPASAEVSGNEDAKGDAVRYELADVSEQERSQLIKGILRNNRRLSKQQGLQAPVSPVLSSASWYSSGSSMGTSEISQQLSPLQHSRFSIGGYVNAHLAVNPSEPTEMEMFDDQRDQPLTETEPPSVWPHGQKTRDSTCSSVTSRARNETASPCSMEAQDSKSYRSPDRPDLQELASAMTTMANTASTVVLDALVDTADKVVVSPLLSIFSCVDASESLLCSGATADYLGQKKRRRNKKLRSRSRRFKA